MVLAVLLLGATAASPASANVGYRLDALKPSRALGGAMKGIAVDQTSQDIYVAIVTTEPSTGKPGQVERFNSNLTADGVFAAAGGYYTGVAVNPITQAFYGVQAEIRTGFINVGTPRLDRFTSTGTLQGSTAIAYSDSFPTVATDSAGNAFVPNVNTDSVQVFDPSGAFQGEITCNDCPGGKFGKPGSVALTSSNDLYVADVAPDRVVKLTLNGGSYEYASTLQSGKGAGAVAVDPATGDVLVGDMPNGKGFHIVAYDSSGTQFDDFGAGIFPDAFGNYGALSAYQIAVNATTHKLYVGEFEKFYVFEKNTIPPPSAAAKPATGTSQLASTLNATVNANGHAVLECEFEYTDETDFQANGFANAGSLPCPEKPKGSVTASLSAGVSNLSPGTAYRFRVTAASNAGSTSSSSQPFETLPAVPPTVTTALPQEVGETIATLRGEVNPHGGATSACHFELGTSFSYGLSIPCTSFPGPVTTNVPEAEKVSGLSPGVKYHYRLVVTTNAGTSTGEDLEFTTSSQPPNPPDPGAPAPAPNPPGPGTGPGTPGLDCRAGFRRQRIHGKPRCVKVCRKGFRRKTVGGKVRCVKKRPEKRRRSSP